MPVNYQDQWSQVLGHSLDVVIRLQSMVSGYVVHVGLADSCHHSNDTPNTPVPNTTINGSRMVRMDKDRALTGGWALDLTDC